VINGEWVPAEFIAKYAGPRKPAARPAPSDRAKLVSVQAECLRLRHVVSDLSLRVAYLENLILKGQTGGALPVATSSGPSPHGDAGASAAASPSASGPSSAPAATSPTASVPAAPAPTGTGLEMPGASDLIRCLEQLIGSDVSAKESDSHLSDRDPNLYVSSLSDSSGAVVAAVLMNLPAVVYLGGTLLMIPESELGPLVSSGTPSEDCLAASSELCGSFSSRIAAAGENPDLDATPLAPHDHSDVAWIANASGSLTLQDNLGGRTTIVLR
jgi:hypothetical protein